MFKETFPILVVEDKHTRYHIGFAYNCPSDTHRDNFNTTFYTIHTSQIAYTLVVSLTLSVIC